MGLTAVKTLHHDLIATIAGLHQRGWCDGTGGNFSAVLLHDPLTLLMAPSGVDKGRVTAEALIEVNGEGRVIKGSGKASAETLMHLEIVRQCGAGAVLHTHSANATVLSKHALRTGWIELEGWEMLKGLKGITSHTTTVRVPVIANDQDLQRLTAAAHPHLNLAPHGLLVAGHGLYAWGEHIEEARRHVEILEFLLDVHWKEQLLKAL